MSESVEQDLARFADGFCFLLRSPVLHTPADQGLEYEDVWFPASDGVPLEGWFIPAHGSRKLVIANHPMGFNRSGMPAHLEPWRSIWGPSGNGFEVDLVPDYRVLHDAGYNVLTYDLRNHGLSSAANGGVTTGGVLEARDVIGSLNYARTRPDTRDMTIGLFSRCMGASSTFAAMMKDSAAFADVRCMVAPQPVTQSVIVERRLGVMGLAEHFAEVDQMIRLRSSFGLGQRVPREWAKAVTVPTFLYQVRADGLTVPSDVQAMYDNIPVVDKKLHWIEDTTARFDGYLEFQRRPEPMLDWFAAHMG